MKIIPPDPQSASELGRSASVGPTGAASDSPPPAPRESASDRVQLSSLATVLRAALSGSAEHLAKLSDLGDVVSRGQYHVDAFAVSGSIIQYTLDSNFATSGAG